MEPQLTQKEQLIERILRMPADKVAAVEAFVEELEDAEDLAIIEARKGEVGIPLDDVLNELGFTREELEKEARDEGLIK